MAEKTRYHYHGSQTWGLREIKSEFDLGLGLNRGIYFAEDAFTAQVYAGVGNPVYRCILDIQRPFVIRRNPDCANWERDQELQASFFVSYWRRLQLWTAGFDHIRNDLFDETVVLCSSQVTVIDVEPAPLQPPNVQKRLDAYLGQDAQSWARSRAARHHRSEAA